ncbi:hypothetical protein OKE68_04270 [Riemerella anatipestifer]|uniref:LysM domain-containing protein n=1 Tax=Riemerella anatipestifer TaxID=34085 RepID=A0AAP3AKP1_RIEAN|nr:hypothetical protein [Riemerella anatipestifer]AZZ59145.1 hypothetical protein AWB57_09000 [Riemerella anatipestifer]MBT0573721.1 hypothetical protein [Riemerella anatipestifer]MCU7567988.1 hypothetical protein [Riemerella anatipestifer]MCW0490009.1 hypothetical protein [Riemerella anatipestifer]MCW0510718.1 hypothetical protein [Riemerella anatipestifer]
MQIIVLHNQSLLDACLQHTGSIEGVFELAMANNLAITDDVQAGTVLQLPEGIKTDRDILSYYTAKGIQPATAITEVVEKCSGIGCWAIGIDFKVS